MCQFLQDPTVCLFCSLVKRRGNHHAETFFMLKWSRRISSIDLALLPVSLKSCLTIMCQSSRNSFFATARLPSVTFTIFIHHRNEQRFEFSYLVCHSIISRIFVTINLEHSGRDFSCKSKNT